ncbi:biopolymer transporter ExbD [uncultured Litoreibacter sp.]|uniref:ExbD/TolR family protein n=1 Tax=uncultured Litoreibacter sp. TaxID=1392394 RepID=UPI0026080078|nr:biopolymer transporter ExbD [uncultured Litoreibacter sp.]
MAKRSIRELPRSERRYTFALTPLADAMFQLLIFFMLTSSLTPYSLLTLQSGPGTGAVPGTQETTVEPPGEAAASWTIENGEIVANGQRFGFESLPQLAQALVAADTPRVLLISSARARVQDIVTVLEILAAANVASVQIVSRGTQ